MNSISQVNKSQANTSRNSDKQILSADPQIIKQYKSDDRAHSVFMEALCRYSGTSEGLFNFAQAMQRVPLWINSIRTQMGRNPSVALEKLSEKGWTAWAWGMALPRIVCFTNEAISAEKEARKALIDGSTPTQASYKAVKSVRETTDAVSVICLSASLTTSLFPRLSSFSKAFATTSDAVTFAHDSIALGMNIQNLKYAYTIDLNNSTEEMRSALEETKKHGWIAIAKEVCSVASGAFGLLLLAFSLPIVSALALATISVAETALSILRGLYEEQMSCKPIRFLDSPCADFRPA